MRLLLIYSNILLLHLILLHLGEIVGLGATVVVGLLDVSLNIFGLVVFGIVVIIFGLVVCVAAAATPAALASEPIATALSTVDFKSGFVVVGIVVSGLVDLLSLVDL